MWFGTLDSEPREIGSLRVWRDEGLDMTSRIQIGMLNTTGL